MKFLLVSGVHTNSPKVGRTRPSRVWFSFALVMLEQVWVKSLQVLSSNPRVVGLRSTLPLNQVSLIVLIPGSNDLVIQDSLNPLSLLR